MSQCRNIFEPSCLGAAPLEMRNGVTDGGADGFGCGSRLSLWKGYGLHTMESYTHWTPYYGVIHPLDSILWSHTPTGLHTMESYTHSTFYSWNTYNNEGELKIIPFPEFKDSFQLRKHLLHWSLSQTHKLIETGNWPFCMFNWQSSHQPYLDLNFVEFDTLHDFQIELANLLTGFASCHNVVMQHYFLEITKSHLHEHSQIIDLYNERLYVCC